jgi:phosphoglycerate dehydrogenase-like enzyme
MPTLAAAMTPERAVDVCDPETRRWLEARFEVRWASSQLDRSELAELVAGSDAVLTSWGTPHLEAGLWADGSGPSVVAHAAGSVKRLVDPMVLDRVAVFSAAGRIAHSVGEYCLAAMLTLARRLPRFDAEMRAGVFYPDGVRGHELAGATVGIVGASSTARALISLLKPFHCDVVVHDPHLDDARASALGVRRAPLDAVTRCAFLSIHVPDLLETRGLISRELIEQIPDGSIVVNSSRGAAVDQAALLEHALSGRILAALDVYAEEPPALAPDALRTPGLLLTPHIAGDTVEGHLALTRAVMQDAVDWLEHGRRGASFVDPASWPVIA